jgi:hypothetical protein
MVFLVGLCQASWLDRVISFSSIRFLTNLIMIELHYDRFIRMVRKGEEIMPKQIEINHVGCLFFIRPFLLKE